MVQVESVHRAQEVLEAADVPVSLREGSGGPATSIVETAADLDVDAVCVAGRQRSPAGKMFFGSVSQSVILESDRPVLPSSPSSEHWRSLEGAKGSRSLSLSLEPSSSSYRYERLIWSSPVDPRTRSARSPSRRSPVRRFVGPETVIAP
ncbi:MAG: universal stress protein [Haloarculaceae archaeon]